MTRADVAAVPVLAAMVLFLAVAPSDGAFHPLVWLPTTLLIIGLAAVSVFVFSGVPLPPTRASAAAAAALLAFAAWSYLTIAWAGVRGIAWEGANRTLAYAIAFALFAALPLARRPATAAVALFGVGAAAIGSGSVALAAAGSTEAMFPAGLGGRFAVPSEYPNASAAFYLMALFAVLPLASSRTVPVVPRAGLLAVAGVLAQLGLLPQSRAAPIAALATVAVALALSSERLRLLVAGAAVAAALAVTGPALLAQTNSVIDRTGRLDAVADAVAIRLAAVFAALFLVGLAFAGADRWLARGDARRRNAVAVVAVVTVLVAAFAVVGTGAVDRAAERARTALEPSRYGAAGSENRRREAWRVALDAWQERPVVGIGADNFAVPYVRLRTSAADDPLYPHSLPVRVLSMTGLVGAAIFLAFLAFAGRAAWSALRASDPRTRAVAAGAVLPFAYWFIHGSVDWLWEVPALSLPALALLALGGSLERSPRLWAPRGRRGAATIIAAALAAGACIAALLPPWLEAREVRAAVASWRERPAASYDHLLRARRLNPLSEHADTTAGAIASRHGDVATMRVAFRRAVERNPSNWYAHLALGVAEASAGNRDAAIAHASTAARLNPRDQSLQRFAARIRAGDPVRPAEVDAAYAPDDPFG